MNRFYHFILCIPFLINACTSADTTLPSSPLASDAINQAETPSATPVQTHGALSVKGRSIIDQNGNITRLAGPSFFWSTTGWGMEKFYNKGAVARFATEWRASVVRAAIAGERKGSYLTDPEGNRKRAYAIIDAAIENGLYVIVDWHSHHAENNIPEAKEFFTDIATRYGAYPNVIYEIYNEPLANTDWETVIKPYSRTMIETIRAIDPDNIIVVGTQSWDQEVDKAADSPLTGYSNIVYALHYYAASHKDDLRKKARYALDKGLPLMVTEWGSVRYDGDGYIDYQSSEKWLNLIDEYDLSFAIWAVADKDESSAMFKPGSPSNGDWKEKHLSESGRYARDVIQRWANK